MSQQTPKAERALHSAEQDAASADAAYQTALKAGDQNEAGRARQVAGQKQASVQLAQDMLEQAQRNDAEAATRKARKQATAHVRAAQKSAAAEAKLSREIVALLEQIESKADKLQAQAGETRAAMAAYDDTGAQADVAHARVEHRMLTASETANARGLAHRLGVQQMQFAQHIEAQEG